MDGKFQKFFLGANSCGGFVSEFGKNYDADDGWSAYIIKGGPGTGKSSFMRHFAMHAAQKENEVVLCPCSSDPNSLDAVILPFKKLIILDGTAPHVVEPSFPGICEEIVNLGAFWNASILKKQTKEILYTFAENKKYHKKASCYLAAAGELLRDSFRIAYSCIERDKCEKYAKKLCRTLLPVKKGQRGREWVRFLQGATPIGVVTYSDTLKSYYENRIIISDNNGAVADCIFRKIREHAIEAGYEIITVKNAFLPDMLIDHILIPELSLGFMCEKKGISLGGVERRVHARRFTDVARLHNYRERMTFDRRAARELISTACESIADAKAVHDTLEKYYISAMDFKGLTDFAEKFVKEKL